MNELGVGTMSPSILCGMLGNDSRAWRRFEAIYRTVIEAWCRARGLQPADAADVAQTVAMKLIKGLPNYQPADPFRPFLYAITQNAINDSWTKRRRDGGESLPAAWFETITAADWDGLTGELVSGYSGGVQAALDAVRRRVSVGWKWEAFAAEVLKGEDRETVRNRWQKRPGTYRQAISTTLKMVREELTGGPGCGIEP